MVNIIKANGDREPFSREKLIQSIQRAKIPQDLQAKVVSQIESTLYEGIPTSEIYFNITDALGKSKEPYAKSRYTLKEAVMQLGPTGYPFEDYFAQILESRGYQVKTRQIMKGKCVTHEIDVLARKNGKTSMVEAKFHNSNGTRTDVHVSMYTKSRFDDVKERYSLDDAIIVTNTKATTDAIAYAECVGMKIFSWSYPEGGSLREAIEELHLYPITALMTISQAQKTKLIANHVVLCKSICSDNYLLDVLNLSKEQHAKVMTEVHYLCESKMPEPAPQEVLQEPQQNPL